ncbi:MAG: hypothetical protein ACFCU8_02905 [Thermosynechococcaceae cyanobacterium]
MTQASINPADELARTQENVRHNEKAIDRLDLELKAFRTEIQADFKDVRADFKDVRAEIKDVRVEVKALSDKLDGFAWKGLVGIVIIVAANIVLKYL